MSLAQLRQRIALEWRSLKFKVRIKFPGRKRKPSEYRILGTQSGRWTSTDNPRTTNFFPGDREA